MSAPLRVLVGSLGLAGHTLPALALARELRAAGHDVLFCGYERWRATARDLGLGFEGGEDRIVASLPSGDATLAETARALLAVIEGYGPDVVVSDGLTLTPALAAELAGIPRATLFPQVYPGHDRALPPFSLGLSAPRSRPGAAAWRALGPLVATRLPSTRWLRPSQRSLNEQRRLLGLPPREGFDLPGDGLVLVATLPELEYPREWPDPVHVTGPMVLDLPAAPVEPPPGDAPLVVVAPSTVKDPDHRLVRAALAALAGEPVRVLVTTGGREREVADPGSPNVVVADWVDFAQVMPRASLVVCHGNHGTVARALLAGVPVLVSPATDDDAEHGARVAWAGAGRMLPRRLLRPATLRAAVRALLADRGAAERARAIAAANDRSRGAERGARLVEAHTRDVSAATREASP